MRLWGQEDGRVWTRGDWFALGVAVAGGLLWVAYACLESLMWGGAMNGTAGWS